MGATIIKFVGKACASTLFIGAILLAQKPSFDGAWQMDTTKSRVSDGRVMAITIATIENNAIKLTMNTKTSDGRETKVEFTSDLNGKACEAAEGTHKSRVTMWYDGPTLNACKENGPVDDVTSVWKFELSPDKQAMTMTIHHYEPAANDETLVFTKKTS